MMVTMKCASSEGAVRACSAAVSVSVFIGGPLRWWDGMGSCPSKRRVARKGQPKRRYFLRSTLSGSTRGVRPSSEHQGDWMMKASVSVWLAGC